MIGYTGVRSISCPMLVPAEVDCGFLEWRQMTRPTTRHKRVVGVSFSNDRKTLTEQYNIEREGHREEKTRTEADRGDRFWERQSQFQNYGIVLYRSEKEIQVNYSIRLSRHQYVLRSTCPTLKASKYRLLYIIELAISAPDHPCVSTKYVFRVYSLRDKLQSNCCSIYQPQNSQIWRLYP